MGNRELNEDATVERWLDEDGPAGEEAPPPWAVDLVRSADPICVSPTQRQRMLLRLSQGQPHRRTAWLRPIVVAALLLGGTTIASAAFTNWPANLVRACRQLVAGSSSTSSALPETASRRRPLALERHPEAAKVEASPAAAPLPMPQPAAPRASADNHPRSRSHADLAMAEDPSLVVEATRALRVARDARRARLLAARYLHQYPGGALAEEARAIVVEAALAERDADGPAQAAQYLALYPHSPFRAAIERALSAR